ncbi:hypothetical protein ACWEOG_23105 [Amycolatopsis japonica]
MVSVDGESVAAFGGQTHPVEVSADSRLNPGRAVNPEIRHGAGAFVAAPAEKVEVRAAVAGDLGQYEPFAAAFAPQAAFEVVAVFALAADVG